MTSSLRRKRPTTAPARGASATARTLASLVGVALLLAGGTAQAQPPPRPLPLTPAPWQPALPEVGPLRRPSPPAPAAGPVQTLSFHKLADPTAAGDLLLTQFQGMDEEDTLEYQIQLEPPSPDRLFKLESEDALRERLRQERRNRQPPERAVFPEDRRVTEERFQVRQMPPVTRTVEPNYVCFGRLSYRELNSEHYGWDLGILQPFVSAGCFYADFASLPYQYGTDPCRCHDTSAGLCRPGDPVPYLLYPPGLSLSGAVAQTGAVLGLIAIFP